MTDFQRSSGALIVVDLQNDFCPGGALAVEKGDNIIPTINRLLVSDEWLRIATRDWHPQNHISFEKQGGIWPEHCVQESYGAQFHSLLDSHFFDKIISKGTDESSEAYSGFQGTELATVLKENGIKKVYLCGLATDYCVLATALDAREEGLKVMLISDCVKSADIHEGDGHKAIQEMIKSGCDILDSTVLK